MQVPTRSSSLLSKTPVCDQAFSVPEVKEITCYRNNEIVAIKQYRPIQRSDIRARIVEDIVHLHLGGDISDQFTYRRRSTKTFWSSVENTGPRSRPGQPQLRETNIARKKVKIGDTSLSALIVLNPPVASDKGRTDDQSV